MVVIVAGGGRKTTKIFLPTRRRLCREKLLKSNFAPFIPEYYLGKVKKYLIWINQPGNLNIKMRHFWRNVLPFFLGIYFIFYLIIFVINADPIELNDKS